VCLAADWFDRVSNASPIDTLQEDRRFAIECQ
jgi:hypothetical protein